MKTMVTIEDHLSAQLASAAQASGKDVDQLVNDFVREGLQKNAPAPGAEVKPFRQRSYDLGLRPEIDYDPALSLAGELDDAERLRKAGLMQ